MTINHNKNDRKSANALRARLEAAPAQDTAERNGRVADCVVAKVALNQLPHHHQRVMWVLQEVGLLAKAEIDYVDRDMRRVDFAWVEKKIGLRITSCPRSAPDRRIPDFVYTDAALRELGWLIFSVDPYSPTVKAQIDRVASVIKRVGAYRKSPR